MNKKHTDVPEERSTRSHAAPVKTFSLDDVRASLFARERIVRGQPRVYHSVAFSRVYRDAQGHTKYSRSFNADDLRPLAKLAEQAYEYLSTRAPETASLS
jgi:hypothetical protein